MATKTINTNEIRASVLFYALLEIRLTLQLLSFPLQVLGICVFIRKREGEEKNFISHSVVILRK